MENYDIDFVVPWVDGNDPEWLAEKAIYDGTVIDSDGEINSVKRYRDWGLMKYWFRGVETYAPWVRKIHFITWGHLPKFLNVNHPKLHIVNHKDFIPQEFLPTYNVNAIEVSLHRIDGLAEHFVYFNDDMFLLSPTAKIDFFRKGLPCDVGTECPDFHDGMYGCFLKNDMNVINRHLKKHEMSLSQFLNWFATKKIRDKLCNVLSYPWQKYIGFKTLHVPTPYLKSSWIDLWRKESQVFMNTLKSRFRRESDVNQDVFHYWQLASGRFKQKKETSKMVVLADSSINEVCDLIEKSELHCLCINDDECISFEACSEKLKASFERRFGKKSLFEI